MLRARSGVQTKAKAEKRSERSQTLALGMCLQRGWEGSHGPAPTRREAEGELGAKLPYKGSRGRGGGAFPADTHPHQVERREEGTLSVDGCTPGVALRRKQLERRQTVVRSAHTL